MLRETLDELVRWLGEAGFSESLTSRDDKLVATGSEKEFDPAQVSVFAMFRPSGESERNSDSLLFAIASNEGEPLGLFIAPPGDAATADDVRMAEMLHERVELPTEVCDAPTHDHIAAVFPDRGAAEAAVEQLSEMGLGSDHLGVAVRGPEQTVFERNEEAVMARRAGSGLAAGGTLGFLGGMALTAIAIPGLAPIGIGGLFAIGAASGFGSAMLGGYLGIASADRGFHAHREIRSTPLDPDEVLVAVLSHGQRDEIESVMRDHGGTLLTLGPSIP